MGAYLCVPVDPICSLLSIASDSFHAFFLHNLLYLTLKIYVLQSSVLPFPFLPNYRLSLKYIHYLGFNNHLLLEIYKLLFLSKFERV